MSLFREDPSINLSRRLLYSLMLSSSVISHSLHIQRSRDMIPRGASKAKTETYKDRFTFRMSRKYQVRSSIFCDSKVICESVYQGEMGRM